jgi:hypothetical protein
VGSLSSDTMRCGEIVWVTSSQVRIYQKELPHPQKWLDANQALWNHLSELLRKLDPQMYVKATGFDYLKNLEGNFTTVSAGSARQNSDSTSSYDPKILKAARHQVNNRIYTLKNIGRDLEPKETLVDVAYKSIEEWEKKKNDFETLKFAIKYETLKKRSKAKGKMPKNIGNQRDVDKFQDIRSERGPILLVDGHGKPLGFRCSIPLELVEQLETTAAILPARKVEESKRGKFVKRHYAVWADCMDHIQPSAEYRKELPHSQQWVAANEALWDHLSELLRKLDPQMFFKATCFQYLKDQPGKYNNFAGAWSGMVINEQMDQASTSKWHYDWQDSECVFNCLVPYGHFTGADLELWELRTRIQISRGEVFFSLGRIIGHRITPVLSETRSVLDLLTHKSNFDDKNRKHEVAKEWQQKRKDEVKEKNKEKMRKRNEKVTNREAS